MKKILIIGQAPPAQNQEVPMDTTMLYDWLKEIGISKIQAQAMFEFDAVFGEFPGYDENGGHKKPTYKQMEDYYMNTLYKKVMNADSIIILGNVAKDFLYSDYEDDFMNKKVICLMHPSRRNYSLYQKSRNNVLNLLKSIIDEDDYTVVKVPVRD